MEFIIAFVIFVIVINIIGLLFSFLWPAIVVLVIVAAIANVIAYHKQRKNGYYQSDDSYRSNQRYEQDDIIDVEYTESDVDEDR